MISPQCAIAATTAAVLAWPGTAYGHEKWFHDAGPFPTQLSLAFQFPGIVAVGVAVALTAAFGLGWRVRRGRDLVPGPEALGATDAGRERFYALVPLILGVHVGLPLVVLGMHGAFLSPNNTLGGAWHYWLGVGQIAVGLSLVYGGFARLGGALLAALWLIGLVVHGVEPMLENLHYLGFAAFFYLTGRGPYAIDRLLFPALEPPPHLSRWAMTALRVGTGLSLAVVAFTEKLANPALAEAFLQEYPLNFTRWIGMPISDAAFVLCAGATELFIGLCLAFGWFPRVIIATAWLFINMTLTVFVWEELVGHLPIYGVMVVLLIWTPEDERLWLRGTLGGGDATPEMRIRGGSA